MTTGTADLAADTRQFGAGANRVANVAGVVGIVGIAAGVLFGLRDGGSVFFRSYLLNICYVLSLSLGALFFVMLQYLTRAGWSVSLRRLAECVAAPLPILGLLFLPMLIPVLTGMKDVYLWTDPQTVANDALLAGKQAFLNVPFFILRCVVYFAVWGFLARMFVRRSLAQDATGDVALTQRMQWWSAPGMLLYAVTVTFFSVDALMSLNPHWFSTIWGVYYFSGAVVGFFALLAVLVYVLQASGRLRRAVTIEHYHDLGKLVFGFVVFWAYIKFSQYMLIWYANIPEETVWYQARQGGPWWVGVSLVLLFGHFLAPFLALLSRFPKRRKGTLCLAGIWLMLMHWVDLYYIVVPHVHGGEHGSPLHGSDLALFVGLGGLFVYLIVRPMTRHNLIPVRDPRLHEALAFENV